MPQSPRNDKKYVAIAVAMLVIGAGAGYALSSMAPAKTPAGPAVTENDAAGGTVLSGSMLSGRVTGVSERSIRIEVDPASLPEGLTFDDLPKDRTVLVDGSTVIARRVAAAPSDDPLAADAEEETAIELKDLGVGQYVVVTAGEDIMSAETFTAEKIVVGDAGSAPSQEDLLRLTPLPSPNDQPPPALPTEESERAGGQGGAVTPPPSRPVEEDNPVPEPQPPNP